MQYADSQVYACCRAVLRYIHRHALRAGDKIPSQNELRGELSFSHNSLTPAMQLLADAGVLRRQRREGTIVLNPSALVEDLWRVAVAVGPLEAAAGGAFSSILTRCLQEELVRSGCLLRLCLREESEEFRNVPHLFSHFRGLQEHLDTARIDAIITPAVLLPEAVASAQQHQIPLCQIGGNHLAPLLADLDSTRLLNDAIDGQIQAGASTIAVIGSFHDEDSRRVQAPLQARLPKRIHLIWKNQPADLSCSQLAQEFLALPTPERPQGVVLLNDMMALEFLTLLREGDWRPMIAVQANRQLPLHYPLPVTRYEFDIQELATAAVRMTQAALLGGPGTANQLWFPPSPCPTSTLYPSVPAAN